MTFEEDPDYAFWRRKFRDVVPSELPEEDTDYEHSDQTLNGRIIRTMISFRLRAGLVRLRFMRVIWWGMRKVWGGRLKGLWILRVWRGRTRDGQRL